MYIGIDGGGTKTKMVSYDDDGNINYEKDANGKQKNVLKY